MMNWGKWILVSFIGFALFIGVLVTISMRQDVNLVATDYYQQELKYQDQIDRIRNTNKLLVKPRIHIYDGSLLKISFPEMTVEEGYVHLFRPSDSSLDQHFKLQNSSDSIQQFKVRPLQKGLYKVKLEWSMDGKAFFMEEIITI